VVVVGDRATRIGQNEALFRAVNEQLEDLNQTFGSLTSRMQLVCECGVPSCADMVELSESEYEAVRADAELFVTATSHATPGVERVVDARVGYDVVRKDVGEPSRVAHETDPRPDDP
jgi:hypothetical protein